MLGVVPYCGEKGEELHAGRDEEGGGDCGWGGGISGDYCGW